MSDTDITLLKEFYLKKIEELEAENRRLRDALKGVIGWLQYTGMATMVIEPSRLQKALKALEGGKE
jgi:hypothetical protein